MIGLFLHSKGQQNLSTKIEGRKMNQNEGLVFRLIDIGRREKYKQQKMQQKYRIPYCSVTNISFNNTSSKISTKSIPVRSKPSIRTTELYRPFTNHQFNSFIPLALANTKKQLYVEFNAIKRRQVKPIKPHEQEKRGFPSRKILTSQSCRSFRKKEKNFKFDNQDIPNYFSNRRINQEVTHSIFPSSQRNFVSSSTPGISYSSQKRRKSEVKPNIFQYV